MQHRSSVGLVLMLALLPSVHALHAQQPAPEAPPASAQPLTSSAGNGSNTAVPVQLQIVLARDQGTKRVSSLPYVLSLNGRPSPGGLARLRMNGSVPVPTTTRSDAGAVTMSSFSYREVGTNIDVSAIPSVEGRYGFNVTVTDSSVYDAADVKASFSGTGAPMFRSFNVSSAVHLRDGETAEFTAATDRLTGEVTKVVVTLTVLN